MKKNLPINKIVIQLMVIILLYLILRIPLTGKALWLDEIYSTFIYLHTHPLVELSQEEKIPEAFDWDKFNWATDWKIQIAGHPPFLNTFYYIWIRLFGDSELSLHIPTIIAGLLGIIILYFFGSLLFGNEVSFIATLATAFSTSHIMHSVQTVHTIFEVLIFLISLLLFYKFIITKDKKFFHLLLVSNIFGIFVFYHYFFYLIIQTTVFWFLKDKLKIKRPYFIVVSFLVTLFFILIIINYVNGRYSYEFWPKNDFKRTVRNMIFLPWHFTR